MVILCSTCRMFLIGGLEHFLFLNILGIIIPTDFHIFQRGWTTRFYCSCCWCLSLHQKHEPPWPSRTRPWKSRATRVFQRCRCGAWEWCVGTGAALLQERLHQGCVGFGCLGFVWHPADTFFSDKYFPCISFIHSSLTDVGVIYPVWLMILTYFGYCILVDSVPTNEIAN